MYCGHCGGQVDNQLQFCPHCGKPLKASKSQVPKSKKPAKKESSTLQIVLYVVSGIVLVLALVLAGLFFFTKDNHVSNQKADNTKTQTSSKDSDKEEYLDEDHKIKRIKGSDYLCEVKTDNGFVIAGIKSDVFVCVTDVVEKRKLGTDSFIERAQGRFVVVSLVVANNQNSAISFSAATNKLVDSNNREYSVSSKGETAWLMFERNSSEDNSLMTEINPGNSARLTLVFDVPPSVPLNDLQLKTTAGFTGGAMILPFNINEKGPVDISEYMELKEKYNQEIGDIVDAINNHLSKKSDFRASGGTIIINAVALRGRIRITKAQLKALYDEEYDHSKSNLGKLIAVYDALEERVDGLIEGMEASQRGGDYSAGFQRGAAAFERYEEANSKL